MMCNYYPSHLLTLYEILRSDFLSEITSGIFLTLRIKGLKLVQQLVPNSSIRLKACKLSQLYVCYTVFRMYTRSFCY